MRKSFILHNDSLDVVNELTIEQKAELFQAIIDYNCGKEVKLTGLMNVVFIPFKNQFIRDSEKYDKVIERNIENGSKGGRPKKTQSNPKNPMGYLKTQVNPIEPKKPYNDNDNDNDSVNDNKNVNKKVNIVPTLKEFGEYALLKKPNVDKLDVKLKYDSWVENGWKDGNNDKIVNWKSKLLNTLPHIKESKEIVIPTKKAL